LTLQSWQEFGLGWEFLRLPQKFILTWKVSHINRLQRVSLKFARQNSQLGREFGSLRDADISAQKQTGRTVVRPVHPAVARRGSVAGSGGAVVGHAGLSGSQLVADAFRQVRDGRADEREDEKAKANDRGGQNHPVNGHGASFVFQEGGEFGHDLFPF
jgi:hypothetical protein